ncbi:SPOR domain-containing protein [Sphingomonas aliaeris]|uniref:SPOR domain-containing protein n=1 Tax=Sphingomonas aliaeris TaxID=2759526 RepID=A0A974S3C6_9SPHN|nr:SPOR domain-containing protein [Sphingomonas aliaeris]QQV76301.1 SPOR domain-containing protein [Sphingomonas aliaeris]
MKQKVLTSAAAIAIGMVVSIPAADAQVPYVQQISPADQLASEMRSLAANPTDVLAMVRAGELTLKLDDTTAAAGFFARAERIDPNNARIKAGKGVILLRAGRPGEALRRFVEAEQLRGDVRTFAADRGLAYDLIGEQERAQRDYRLALKSGSLSAVGIDETTRRYALSLGISGKKDQALAQIDPLLRRSDRGAWRARAFILAMTGDGRGAEKIAQSMMPGGLSQGLQPFFEKLPTLRPADRAFAVHFGEVRTTPMRLADARMAPALGVLPPDPDKPVALASVTPQPAADTSGRNNKRDRKRNKRDKVNVAVAQAAPVPLPPPPAYQGAAVAMVQPLPNRPTYSAPVNTAPSYSAPTQVAPARTNPSVALASNRGSLPSALPVPRREVQPNRAAAETDVRVAAGRTVAPSARPQVLEEAAGPYEPIGRQVVASSPSATVATAPNATTTPATMAPAPAPITSPATVAAAPTISSSRLSGEGAYPSPVVTAAAPTASTIKPLPPVPGPVKGEDPILAAIIANITVPGSELEVSQPASEPEPVRIAEARPIRPIARAPVRTEPDTAALQAKALADKTAADKAAADKRLADKKLADKKLADKKLADKKIADAKKLADAKKAAEDLKKKNDPKLLEPSRIWVQVAGGANEGDLPKEWSKVREKAPAAFKGKSGWMTPLRATNRVLTGPFKTDAEARSFVNTLAKEGVSGFAFTSEAGQKVTRLAGK